MTELERALAERILVLDGAMGTQIQSLGLSSDDFGGERFDGCNEHLVLTKPSAIRAIHCAYFDAGADIATTNTFGATPLVLAEYGLAEKAREINRQAARIAREAAEEATGRDKVRFVAGSMGPTTKAMSVTGGVTFQELRAAYRIQAGGLLEGGVDYLLLETCQDTCNVKAALLGISDAFSEAGRSVPVAVSCTIEPTGTMLCGQGVEAFYTSIEHFPLLYVGLNCATGPAFMADHIRGLAALADCAIGCVPNAGLPDEHGRYNESPEEMAAVLEDFARQGWINLLGSCCGSTPEHTRQIAEISKRQQPRRARPARFSRVSGIEFQSLEVDRPPLIVGERTNVIGSRKFKDLIASEDFDRAAEVGRAQVRGGAHILDVCLANPDRDEKADMERFLPRLLKKVKVPIMIDSTDAQVIELALTLTPGKSIINSVNLEDGEERIAQVVPLAKRYGAAVVVGCIDDDKEQGMALTAARKLAVARRAYELLTGKYGLAPHDIIFDPLVFPAGTGDEKLKGAAAETIAGLAEIKRSFPQAKTILGISNVSFGLPASGREVLNSVFLYHAIQAGLDLAIVNSEKLVRFASIPDEERKLAEDLLWNRGEDPLGSFASAYRERSKAPAEEAPRLDLPVETRLARHIIEGTREGLEADLEEALGRYAPLDIINGPLMDGMAEVGRLFGENKLIVAEVLQSAEAMKVAVDYLEPRMDKVSARTKGKVILATVKGDVHDIGKNLVDIILSNNGYDVVNLGIKVEPARIVEAVRRERPTIVGLSGLLVKSAQQMVATVSDMKRAGIDLPVLVGGAALTKKFTRQRIAPAYDGVVAYAADAMAGLALAEKISAPGGTGRLASELAEEDRKRPGGEREENRIEPTSGSGGRTIGLAPEIPKPPDLKRHEIRATASELLPWVNPVMLYGKHLGLKGNVTGLLREGDEKAAKLKRLIEELVAECEQRELLRPAGVFRFYAAWSREEEIALAPAPGAKPVAVLRFPRQVERDRLCVADWVEPAGGRPDYVALFVTTAGAGVRERAEELKNAGDYLRSHALQALALEMAEAMAEWLHAKLRSMWGFPDPPALSRDDVFKARYRGIRVSFGYPACPDLEQQEILFSLLSPESIGVTLTEGFMMEPEASVSAMVFHHPAARYFSALPGAALKRGR